MFQNATHKDVIAEGDEEAAKERHPRHWERGPFKVKADSTSDEEEEEVQISVLTVLLTLAVAVGVRPVILLRLNKPLTHQLYSVSFTLLMSLSPRFPA